MTNYIQKGLIEYPDSDVLTTGTTVSNIFLQNIVTDYKRVPAWWSTHRDSILRKKATENDFLAGVLFTLQTILYNINYQVLAEDNTIERHNQLAKIYDSTLQMSINNEFEKFIMDVLVTDNGGFLYIDGAAPPYQPLDDIPYGLQHRDSTLITRTRNKTYPVVYHDPDGKDYAIHWSRIISFCQSPTSQWDMNGVGYGTVSKIYILAQHLLDIAQYDAENLGSLNSTNLYVASGASSRDLEAAFGKAEIDSINEGRQRTTKNVYLGFRDPQAKLNRYGFRIAPEGYDKQSDIEITLTQIALMIGVNPVILFDSVKSSSTRGGSKTAQKISESKLFAWFVKKLTTELALKFLPPSLQIVRPGEDLDLDGTKSRIALNNSLARKNNIDYGVTNERVERERMLRGGEIDEVQFEKLELENERLQNGLHISTLFYDQSAPIKKYLEFPGVTNVLNVQENNADAILAEIQVKLADAVTKVNKSTSQNISRTLWRVIYALQWLENQYQTPDEDIDVVDVENDGSAPKVTPESDQNNIAAENERSRDRENENAVRAKEILSIIPYEDGDYNFTTKEERIFIKSLKVPTRAFWANEINKEDYISEMVDELGNEYLPYIEVFANTVENNQQGTGKLTDIYSTLNYFSDLTN